ncbi:MAG TPA: CheR family methyltransferase [Polyangiaceae bacterium]|nr:CheR family methyltransferase [Polyangiaceae bacterium]
MTESDALALLAWALPRLGLRERGFVHVRGQVCKRLRRRMLQLGLPNLAAYRARLERDAQEWQVLRGLCAVTISRFYRDAQVWDALRQEVLPQQVAAASGAGESSFRCWSVGCASGEEPYTLSIVWALGFAAPAVLELGTPPTLKLRVLGTDVSEPVLARGNLARYEAGTLRELPAPWREQAFEAEDGGFRLREAFRTAVELRRGDVRASLPPEMFHLILCRNIVCTYFDERLQTETLERLSTCLAPGGLLLLGRNERLPAGAPFEPWRPELGMYRARSSGSCVGGAAHG